MATLSERVLALPQELYDEVFDLTFTTSVNTIHIDEAYCPPTALQVSQATRCKIAESYYGRGSIFYVSEDNHAKWLYALSCSHYELLGDVRITNKTLYIKNEDEDASSFTKLAIELACANFALCHRLDYSPIDQDMTMLSLEDGAATIKEGKFKVVFGQPEKKAWISHEFLGRVRRMQSRKFGRGSAISTEDLHKIQEAEHERQI